MAYFNLLSPDHKQALHAYRWQRLARHIAVSMMCGTFVIAVLFFAAWRITAENAQDLQDLRLTPAFTFNAAINRLNTVSRFLTTLHSDHYHWSETLVAISQETPPGISLTAIDFSSSQKTAMINGQASDRDSLLRFQTALEESRLFRAVELPIQTIAQKNDITFTVTATLETDALH